MKMTSHIQNFGKTENGPRKGLSRSWYSTYVRREL